MGRIKSENFQGVYLNILENGDISYSIMYKDIINKAQRVNIGKASQGVTEEFCFQKRNEIINNITLGGSPNEIIKNRSKKNKVRKDFMPAKTLIGSNGKKIGFYFFASLFSTSKQTISRWLKNETNVPILNLITKYFNEEDLEEFLKDGKIKKYELISKENSTNKAKDFSIINFLSNAEISKIEKLAKTNNMSKEEFIRQSLIAYGVL